MNPSPSSEQVPAWTILRVEDYPIVGPGGFGQRGKRVHFQLADGTASYVEVPLSDFNAQRVNTLVNEHAITMMQVLGLQGSALPQY